MTSFHLLDGQGPGSAHGQGQGQGQGHRSTASARLMTRASVKYRSRAMPRVTAQGQDREG